MSPLALRLKLPVEATCFSVGVVGVVLDLNWIRYFILLVQSVQLVGVVGLVCSVDRLNIKLV